MVVLTISHANHKTSFHKPLNVPGEQSNNSASSEVERIRLLAGGIATATPLREKIN